MLSHLIASNIFTDDLFVIKHFKSADRHNVIWFANDELIRLNQLVHNIMKMNSNN